MKTILLFLFSMKSVFCFSQTDISIKVTILNYERTDLIHVQKNKEPKVLIKHNISFQMNVEEKDVVLFFINNENAETIAISKNIIENKSFGVVLSNSTVLDELKIDRTNLNNKLGFGNVQRYTRAERAVKRDNQLSYKDPYSDIRGLKLDGLVNKISGRAKINRKALVLDTELTKMERFLSVYTPDYLFDTYKLPKDKAVYFALYMTKFIDKYTNLESLYFKEKVKEELLNLNMIN